jgi:cytolysin-activating lysine-acyltransferase
MTNKTTVPQTPAELEALAKLAQEQAARVTGKLPLLGPVVWLMMQQGHNRHAFVGDLEWRVLPALVLEQAKLFMQGNMPIAYVSWAKLSTAAAQRYRQPPHHLAPGDWKSGDAIWIVDIIAPFGSANEVLQDLREKMFPTSRLYQLAPMPESVVKVIEWEAVKKAS